MAQDNVQIARDGFAAWNAHDGEAFIKLLDARTVWDSDVFPTPFAGPWRAPVLQALSDGVS